MSTTPDPEEPTLSLEVNGRSVTVPDRGETLLDVIRGRLGLTGAKDGCSPQGQCGCCTVLVDGKPRVACVTPARRVRGRSVTTLEGLDPDRLERWGQAFCTSGGSQCGFCTPGIVVRLDSMVGGGDGTDEEPSNVAPGRHAVDQALLAHLCRCTGWQTIGEAVEAFCRSDDLAAGLRNRDLEAAARRAAIEGGGPQTVAPDIALGQGRFAADTAPDDALVAVAAVDGSWVVGETLADARAEAGKVQGRRTTVGHQWPLDVPDGTWDATLRTTWVDPAYLETDATWCEPGGTPYPTAANGGAFGAKPTAPPTDPEAGLAGRLAAASRELADRHGRPVLVLASREDVARHAAKRPPVAAGMNADGTGVVRIATTAGADDVLHAAAPGLRVEQVEVPGPPTSMAVRAAGWAEVAALRAGATGRTEPVRAPSGGVAEASLDDGVIRVSVGCGPSLDETVLRSYCIGAAHMAWSWLTGEAQTVDADGEVHDLTIRSFGVLRAVDTPPIEVEIRTGPAAGPEPVNGSDAVFAAVAAAGWLALGCRQDWPVGLP